MYIDVHLEGAAACQRLRFGDVERDPVHWPRKQGREHSHGGGVSFRVCRVQGVQGTERRDAKLGARAIEELWLLLFVGTSFNQFGPGLVLYLYFLFYGYPFAWSNTGPIREGPRPCPCLVSEEPAANRGVFQPVATA